MDAALAWAVCNVVAIDAKGNKTPKCVFLQWVPFAAPALRKVMVTRYNTRTH